MKKIIFALIMLTGFAPAAFSQIVRSTTFTQAPKEKGKTEWFVRLGLSCNNLTGSAMSEAKKIFKEEMKEYDSDEKVSCKFSPRVGYDITTGFNKYFGKTNVYWGMELGLGTRGGAYTYKYDWEDYKENQKCYVNSYNVKYTPFTVGYKYPINDNIKIDAHLGIFLSFDFAGTYTEDEWEIYDGEKETWKESCGFTDEYVDGYRFDAGLQLGIGVWFNKFNLNFTWQRGFAPYIGAFPFGDEIYNRSDDHLYYNSSNAIISIAYAF